MVFQSYALYPTMSIYENIRFPLRMRGVPAAEHDKLVRHPRVFLMDEPLSNLDAKLRLTMRAQLKRIQRRLETTIYVTHDQIEATTPADRIAIMQRVYII